MPVLVRSTVVKKSTAEYFLEVRRIEDAAVFGGGHFKAMLLAESRDGLLQNAGVSVGDLDHLVFKARRLGEDEHGLFSWRRADLSATQVLRPRWRWPEETDGG